MKTLTAILFSMLFWAMSAHAQTLYAADTYELRNTNPCGFFDGGKIYIANAYGLSKKVVGFIEDGKIYSADVYEVKDYVVGYIEGKTIFNADNYGVKYKPIAFLADGKVYAADVYGVKGKVIGFYSGDNNTGAACAAILRLVRRH
ncbi:hypothetical protein [Mucilaginibacter sp. dw_454]|uniref:hypothetical protein n=1 Tax=Mucilaginibacter sp. dw_454 TaxID=2720079 RepID=UPI001BD1C12E|nr:hypothetical protein [Mucilaginibacter sp. dw_454]